MAGSIRASVIKTDLMATAGRDAGYWRIVWRRFKRHRVAYIGFFFFIFLLLLVTLGPHVAPYQLDQISLGERMHSPSFSHWFGTDELGRDTWVRIMHGGRVSLAVGLTVGFSTVILGGLIGILAGYLGGVVDNALMRLVDMIYTIPRIVLLLVLSKLAGPGLLNIIIILVALEWTNAARLARGAVLSFREQEFVLAAQCLGASQWRVMLRHLLPNSLAPLIVAGRRRRHSRGNDIEFSRSRHPTSDAKLGESSHQRCHEYLYRSASGVFTWPVYLFRPDELQSARRRAARRFGSSSRATTEITHNDGSDCARRYEIIPSQRLGRFA
jgi:ABC-type dipeptide/oligopeptide/nickel transport system permease subunit